MSFKKDTDDKQADRACKLVDGRGLSRHDNKDSGLVHSSGTLRTFHQAYKGAAGWMRQAYQGKSQLHHMKPSDARRYLDQRTEQVGQKTLNNERRALELYFRKRDRDDSIAVERVISEHRSIENSRAYSSDQVQLIASDASDRMGFAIRVASEAGLRAVELHSLRPIEERGPSGHRASSWIPERFSGREDWHRYTVIGKGGLIREVRLSPETAAQLEARRLDEPRLVIDRTIKIDKHYDLPGGQSFSNTFTTNARTSLGWSHGAHGLRHGYAQLRMAQLADAGVRYERALEAVSQEMGHFRADITEVYLR